MFPNDIEKYNQLAFEDQRGSLRVILEGVSMPSDVTLKRSISKRDVFRGMHYQSSEAPQLKYIEILSGKIVDFVVCMDKERKEYGEVFQEIIRPGFMYKIPHYYAHGFYAMEDTVFQYITVGKYSQEHELAFKLPDWSFTKNGIDVEKIIMSTKDAAGPSYNEII